MSNTVEIIDSPGKFQNLVPDIMLILLRNSTLERKKGVEQRKVSPHVCVYVYTTRNAYTHPHIILYIYIIYIYGTVLWNWPGTAAGLTPDG